MVTTNEKMPPLRVAVLSDIHFYVKKDTSTPEDSYLPLDTSGRMQKYREGKTQNPRDALTDLISTEALTCDIVLCLGDITTRADPIALKTGWDFLRHIGETMKAKRVYATTGNHDVRSRSDKAEIDKNPVRNLSLTVGPLENLKTLTETYPVIDFTGNLTPEKIRRLQADYFGECFTLIDDDESVRVLIFNGCSEHGHDPHEFERGTVPASSLNWIKHDLTSVTKEKINLCICHHPPYSQSGSGQSGYDFLSAGDQLLESLEFSDQWLVLHGHKHLGKISNAASKYNRAPIVFSAASFAAKNEDSSIEGYENQFYILELERDPYLKGTVSAWQWNLGEGWQKSKPGDLGNRIHYGSGFGCDTKLDALASQIKSEYDAGNKTWKDVQANIPEIRWLMPGALHALIDKLRTQHQIAVEKNDAGFYYTLARSYG